jgi:DUF1680 family protein
VGQVGRVAEVTWDPASAGLRAHSAPREGGQLLRVPAPKVPDKIAAQAEPFDLADVRLLDGPFRDAMLRDQQYLLALDIDRLLHTFRVNAGLPSSANPLGGWETPYYTLHKIMAGLLDVHLLCGNAQALDILVKMADWVKFR